MANVEVKLNSAGVRELLKSAEVKQVCYECAEQVAARAGDGFEIEPRNYPERSGYAVKASDAKSYYHNQKHNTLIRAITG